MCVPLTILVCDLSWQTTSFGKMADWSRFSASDLDLDDEDREGFTILPERKNRAKTTALALRNDNGFD